MNDPIRILIVDDHLVVREGLKGMLASQPDFAVVGEADNGATGVGQAVALRPDVILMDLRMPGTDGVSAIRSLSALNLDAQVLVLTTYDTDADIVTAIEAGATGYLLKDSARGELFDAIRKAARGEAVLSPTVATRVMDQMRRPAGSTLSARELEVLAEVAKGQSNREIGRVLHISEATVKTHLLHIYGKLGVNDRAAAVAQALDQGLLRLDR